MHRIGVCGVQVLSHCYKTLNNKTYQTNQHNAWLELTFFSAITPRPTRALNITYRTSLPTRILNIIQHSTTRVLKTGLLLYRIYSYNCGIMLYYENMLYYTNICNSCGAVINK